MQAARSGRNKQHLGLLLALSLPCQACALSYADSNGDRHVIGLVDITIHPAGDPRTFAGDVVDLTSVGFTAAQTAQGGFIALGYNREISATLRNDVLVAGNPLTPGEPGRTERDRP